MTSAGTSGAACVGTVWNTPKAKAQMYAKMVETIHDWHKKGWYHVRSSLSLIALPPSSSFVFFVLTLVQLHIAFLIFNVQGDLHAGNVGFGTPCTLSEIKFFDVTGASPLPRMLRGDWEMLRDHLQLDGALFPPFFCDIFRILVAC